MGLEGEKKRVNYPEMEFCKDRTAVLYSQADTIYRFTFYTRKMTRCFLLMLMEMSLVIIVLMSSLTNMVFTPMLNMTHRLVL